MAAPIEKVECEFTLALNNKTGKFLFCKELIDETADLIERVWYWRISSGRQPRGLTARVLGRLAQKEVGLRFRHPQTYNFLPAISRRAPVVFTDPRECVLYSLKSYDVVICHDMGPLTHSGFYHPGVYELYRSAFKRISEARPHMMFVSDASRVAFVELFGDDFPSLRVVHIPLRHAMEGGEESPVPGVPERFLLTVGAIGARKNQCRSIAAFLASGLAKDGYGYVLCGGPEPGYGRVAEAAESTEGVRLTGHVSDSQLRWLYRRACGFVLPSLLEGFGLPAAEAINFGLIPIVSRGGALHEVTGESALLVDPLKIDNIAGAMRSLVEMDDGERAIRINALKRHILLFSREKTMAAWRCGLQAALRSANAAS